MSAGMLKSRRHSAGKLPGLVRAHAQVFGAARPSHLREANCRTLLRLLRANSPCSKADLVRISGLSATTVSAGVAQLNALGLVEELGDAPSSGGRPASLLRFHSTHGYVAAADVGGTRIRMMLADLNGRPVADWSTHMSDLQKTPRGVVSLLNVGIGEMRRQSGVLAPVLHITVGAPGITDVSRGLVLAAPNLQGWTDVPLQALVEAELSMPATVENDVNLAAMGERARGVADGLDDYVFIALGTGVGAGIFVGGQLHHGADWSAGEIGYLPVAGMPRETIRLARTGQLERVIGGEGIESMWQEALRREGLHEDEALSELRASQIFDLADQGHSLAAEAVMATARVLADAIGTLALLFNPKMVVLGGGVGSHRKLCSATAAFLRENEFAQPEIRTSSLRTEAQLFGAIALSLSAVEAELLC